MANTEQLNQYESQEGFIKHEFGKMIETPTARAILVDDAYGDYGYTETEFQNGTKLRERTRKALEELGLQEDIITQITPLLISIKTESGYGSGVLIRPNVIMTAAHVLRDPYTGDVKSMKALVSSDQYTMKVQSIYFNKIGTEDIAFIVTHEDASSYLNIYNNGTKDGKGVFILGISGFIPRFTKGENKATLYQYAMKYRPGGMDKDNDGVDDSEDYLLANNAVLPGDSGGVAISDSGEIIGIVSQGPSISGINVGGSYLEPHSKIVQQYGDFIQAMTKLGVEIK